MNIGLRHPSGRRLGVRHGGARKDLPGPFVEIIDKKLGQKLNTPNREGGLDISIYGPCNQDGGSGSK